MDSVILFPSNVTAVCDNALPSNVAPVAITIPFDARIIPLKFELVPRDTPVPPPTCQNIFAACTPPLKVTIAPFATIKLFDI